MARKALKESTAMAADAGNGAATELPDGNDEGRKRVISYDWSDESPLTIVMSRGKNEVRSFDLTELNDEMRMRAFRHGIIQKMADSYAGKTPDGTPKAADAENIVDNLWKHLVDGSWTVTRGESAERTSLFLEAYVRVMNARGNALTVEEFRKRVNDIESGDDAAKKAALKGARENVEINETINTIRMERLNARVGDKPQASLETLLA